MNLEAFFNNISENKENIDSSTDILKDGVEFRDNKIIKNENKIYSLDELKGSSLDDFKVIMREETPWSSEIIDNIKSYEEYEVYKNANLVEAEINGKKCLIKEDIDFSQKDNFGRTNKERIEQGLAPLDNNMTPLELHHIGQKPDSPLAELRMEEHRGKGNDNILHDKTKESEIDRQEFAKERSEHWKNRIMEV